MVFLKTAYTMILLQTVMVSPGTHLLKNRESLSRTNEFQLNKKKNKTKKTWSTKLNMLGPLCNQTVNLKTDAKTIYYMTVYADFPPRETSPMARSEEIRLFSQATDGFNKK